MKFGALSAAITDTTVLEFAKRLRQKRLSIASNRLAAGTVPISSGQGWLRRLGFEKVDIAASPELTVAKVLKEWRRNANFHRIFTSFERPYSDPAERDAKTVEQLNRDIAYIEYQIFGNDPTDNYPKFIGFREWLAWRVQLAHPEYRCDDLTAGWTNDLYDFAISDSELAFK